MRASAGRSVLLWLPPGILAIAVALRVYGLDDESAWLDEAFSISIARGGVETVLRETGQDVHPPLYYLLLHAWMLVTGGSVWAARLLSVVFSVGALLAAHALAARLAGSTVGLATMALLTVSVFQIEFAQEARMYALLTLLATLSTAALVRLFGPDGRRWLLPYVVVTSLMTYTHVYAAFVISAHAVTVLLDARQRRRMTVLGRWLLAQFGVLLAFLPWLPVFVDQVSEVQADFWIRRPRPIELGAPLYAYAGSAVLLVVLLPLAIRGIVALARQPDPANGAPPPLWILVPWLVAPIALPFALSYIGSPIFMPRYTIPASIPWAIAVAVGIGSLPWRAARVWVLAACLVLSAHPLFHYYRVQTKDGWREVAAALEDVAQPGDVVVLYPPYNSIPFRFYYQRPDVEIRSLPLMNTLDSNAWRAMVEEATADLQRVWFVALRLDPTREVAIEAFKSRFVETSARVVQKIAIHRLERPGDVSSPRRAGARMVDRVENGFHHLCGFDILQRPMASVEHKQVFRGRHLTNRLLTGKGSGKITRHHEIAIESSPAHYLPGDALGLHPINDPALVDRVLAVMGATGDEVVPGPGDTTCTFREALQLLNLNTPTRRLIELFASRGVSEYTALLDKTHAERLREYVAAKDEAHDVLDMLEAHRHVQVTPEELTTTLRRNLPRLYSVASSQKAYPDQVHLLVVSVRYTIRGRERLGVCSTWLADRWPVGETAEMYLQNQQKHFAMPSDPATPMIMIGPGTGLAPFRAFLQERRATGATGRNWLFFGEQHRATDFFYEDELTAYERDGFLRLDLAFSRDQAHKIYVQHRMREHARDIWAWLEEGAELFVCGDKERMAADVDRELLQIVQTAGGRTEDQAHEYVEALKASKRYKRDVY